MPTAALLADVPDTTPVAAADREVTVAELREQIVKPITAALHRPSVRHLGSTPGREPPSG